VVAAVATVIGAVATEEVVITRAPLLAFALIVLAVFAAVVTIVVNARETEAAPQGDAEGRVRRASRSHSMAEMSHGDILNRRVDEVIPVSRRGAVVTMASFVAEISKVASRSQWVIEGDPGSGKSTLLHRIVEVMNADPRGMTAVVVPLATYDWEHESFADWLSQEIAQITGVAAEDVSKLIADDRLFVLLDGIEDVPNDMTLDEQELPGSERAIVDRRRSARRGVAADPRRRLISSLATLPGFVLTGRGAELTDDERIYLQGHPRAQLRPIPPDLAWAELVAYAPQLRSSAPGDAFIETIRSPLYLRLAGRVCGAWDESPDLAAAKTSLERWLWDRYLDHRLASRQMQEFGWDPTRFRHWLASCAAALPPPRDAIALRRWPLLYGARTRELFRLARSAVSGAITGAFALSFLRPLPAAGCGIACGVLFLLFGEGAATRPLAVRPFPMARLRHLALRQGTYALGFVVTGGAFGLLVSIDPGGALWRSSGISTPEAVLVGSVGGALLTAVPTLYELFYLDDAALYGTRYRDGAIGATLGASAVIGLLGGAVVAAALVIAFPTTVVLVAIPAAVMLAVLDTLGLPFVAIGLWALQGRGPLDVGAFLRFAEELRVARRFGQYHFLEHRELQSFLIEEEDREEVESRPAIPRVAVAGCALAAVWLVAYSLLHLSSSLPSSYVASHWRILWVGLDLMMAALAVVTLIGVRRRSALAALSAAMLAGLLLSDGWFDCLTANASDLSESLASLGAELAGAIFFLWVAVEVVRRHLVAGASAGA
jgi:hypothetical protein